MREWRRLCPKAARLSWLCVVIPFFVLGGPSAAGAAHSYAIVIGISHYEHSHWPALPNGRPDAEQVAALFEGQGFQVRAFLDQNATVAQIDAYIEDELAPHLQVDDRVLFFFSGHGQTRTPRIAGLRVCRSI